MSKGKLWAESILLQFPIRVALGGVFMLAAYNKINGIQSFAEAIKGFKVIDAEEYGHLIVTAAYTMPWAEMIVGVLLVLGLWTRAAAAGVWIMLVGFIAALIHVIMDETISADCSCFGDMEFICPPGVSWCQVGRNLVLLIPTTYLVWRQGGFLALDRVFRDKSMDDAPEWTVDNSEKRG